MVNSLMRRRRVGAYAVAFALASPAAAQDAAPSAGSPPLSGIEEIVVTATKREQNIQDVPIAVTALSEVMIERAGVKDLRDLPTLSPSFNMNSSQTESQGSTLRIRGDEDQRAQSVIQMQGQAHGGGFREIT